jgi:hypothetical protein
MALTSIGQTCPQELVHKHSGLSTGDRRSRPEAGAYAIAIEVMAATSQTPAEHQR